MKEEQHQFLALVGQPPAPLAVEAGGLAARLPGSRRPVLVAAKLLKPLGNPPQNGIKFFATAELVESMKERNWLTRVTVAINQHWHQKNVRCKRRVSRNLGLEPAGQLSFAGAANE